MEKLDWVFRRTCRQGRERRRWGGRGGLIAVKIRFTIVNFIAVIFPNYNKNG